MHLQIIAAEIDHAVARDKYSACVVFDLLFEPSEDDRAAAEIDADFDHPLADAIRTAGEGFWLADPQLYVRVVQKAPGEWEAAAWLKDQTEGAYYGAGVEFEQPVMQDPQNAEFAAEYDGSAVVYAVVRTLMDDAPDVLSAERDTASMIGHLARVTLAECLATGGEPRNVPIDRS